MYAESYEHKILIANPVITDPAFAGKAIFLQHHSPELTQGIVLNGPEVGKMSFLGLPLSKIKKENLSDIIKDTARIHSGGPCETPSLYFIHNCREFSVEGEGPDEQEFEFDLGIPNTFDSGSGYEDRKGNELIDGVFYGSPATFCNIIMSGKKDDGRFRFYIGTSFWGPGQLREEIDAGAWKVVDSREELFFDENAVSGLFGKKRFNYFDVPKSFNPLLN